MRRPVTAAVGESRFGGLQLKNKNGAVALAASAAIAMLAAAAPNIAAAEAIRISVSDLDLSTRAGAAEFAVRVDRAAAQLCLSYGAVYSAPHKACVQSVREDAHENLAAQQRKGVKLAALSLAN